MKAATIASVLLAAGTTMAAPAKRTVQDVTVSNFVARQTDSQAFISFSLSDPNFNQEDTAAVSVEVTSQPPAETLTHSQKYAIQFPNGFHSIEQFLIFNIVRVNGSETIPIALNSDAADSSYACSADQQNGGEVCTFSSMAITPTFS